MEDIVGMAEPCLQLLSSFLYKSSVKKKIVSSERGSFKSTKLTKVSILNWLNDKKDYEVFKLWV